MKISGLSILLVLLANINVIEAKAQLSSEQMRYAQQRQKWRSEEIHKDVQSHMDEVHKRLEASRNRMPKANFSSLSRQASSLGESSHARTGFSPVKINEISTYPGNPDYRAITSCPNASFGSIASMRFITSDAPRRVYDFYTKDLQAHGWKFNTSKCNGQHLSATHDKANRSVSITYKAVSGGTQVELSYSRDKLFTQSNDPLKYMIKTSDMSNLGNNERVKMNNSAFGGLILPGTNLDNNERIQRGLK